MKWVINQTTPISIPATSAFIRTFLPLAPEYARS
jgi:hypothetical protein